MSDPSDSGTGRKRPLDGHEEGSNKHRRTSQSVIRQVPDEYASQTFVTEDNQFITDSIPNHVRRHDGEIARQAKSLHAVLNAHGGFEERVARYGARLEEISKSTEGNKLSADANTNSIQQLEANSSKKALDEIARVDDRITQQLASYKDTTETRLDAIDRERDQHNAKVQRMLSTMTQCLQEFSNPTELAAEGSQPTVDQDAQVKASSNQDSRDVEELPHVQKATAEACSEDPEDHQQPDTEDVDTRGTRQRIWAPRYFHWLKTLDFRNSSAIDMYTDADYRFQDMELFKYKTATYYMVRESPQLPPIIKKTRAERLHYHSDDSYVDRPHAERCYLDHVLEVEVRAAYLRGLRNRPVPRYVLHLGYMFVNDPKATISVMWTGFRLVMDITTPDKPIWLVHGREDGRKLNDFNQPEPAPWPTSFPGIVDESYDFIRFAIDIGKLTTHMKNTVRDYVKKSMAKNAYNALPVFTIPNFDSLQKAIKDGWRDCKSPEPFRPIKA
ncbi:hypothetical protein PG996_000131 [Apiospora saccharicola]|uniref:Uncharacterized protein n=1 Tax=Apiospora saccharicola TaxID=335842 RepID=A0ABR1WFV2_9PEZI